MSDTPAMPYDYQSEGGALLIDAPTYVKRKADNELYEGLKAGQFCYVLNARQMGKSSLKVRTLQRLRDEGIACAAVDLQGIGTSATEEQWYFGVLSRIARSLGLHRKLNLNTWWTEQPRLSYVQRFVEFLESVLLPAVSGSIVVFIDEVDLTLTFPFRDDFFGALRETYNRRADEPEFRRLTFALFGVASPSDLIQNKQITPFNIGRPVDLTGFQLEEAQPLLFGLTTKAKNPQVLLQAILNWTGGQPFLTQKLCKLVQLANSEPLEGQENEWVEQLVQTRVIENWEAQDIPPHLKTIRDRLLLSGEEQTGRLLGLYQQIVQHGEIAADDSPEQVNLRLTGLVVKRSGMLRVYNRIYQQVFDRDWLERSLFDLRPYGSAISAWLESGCQDESRLLRGQALQDARIWAEGKSLGDDDRRFLDASQELEKRDIQKKLAAEEEAKRVLAEANRKANQRIRVGFVALCLMLSGAIASGFVAQQKIGTADQAERKAKQFQAKADEAAKQRESVEQQREEAEQKRKNADKLRKEAELQQKQAEVQAKQAKQNLELAVQREKAATEQFKLAQVQSIQARQEAEKAQLIANQARADQAQAQIAADAARQKEQAANAQVTLARADLSKARESEIASRVESANSLFKLDQKFESLLESLRAAHRIKTLEPGDSVNVDTRLSSAIALNQAIYGSRERNRIPILPSNNSDGFKLSPLKSMIAWVEGEDYANRFGVVRIWDINGKEIRKFKDRNTVFFSPNEKTVLLTRSFEDFTIANLDGSEVKTPSGKLLAVNEEKGLFAILNDSQAIQIWDLNSLTLKATLPSVNHRIYASLFSPDGRWLAIIDRISATVTLGNIERNVTQSFKGGAINFSPDSKVIAVSADFANTFQLRTIEGQLIKEIEGFDVSFSPDGKTLAARVPVVGVGPLKEGKIKLWRTDGTEIATFDGFDYKFSPDGSMIGVIEQRRIRLWKTTGDHVTVFDEGASRDFAFSPDSKMVAIETNGIINLYTDLGKKPSERREVRSISGINPQFSPNGKTLIISTGNQVKLVNLETGDEETINAQSSHRVKFGKDNRLVVFPGSDDTLRIMQLEPASKPILLANEKNSTFLVNSKTILVTKGQNLEFWKATGQKLRSISINSDFRYGFYNFGALVYVISNVAPNEIQLFNDSGTPLRTLKGHTGRINRTEISPDGQTLASLGDDNTIRAWDIQSGRALASFSAKGSDFVDFVENKKLVSGFWDDTKKRLVDRILDIETGKETPTIESDSSQLADGTNGFPLINYKYNRLWHRGKVASIFKDGTIRIQSADGRVLLEAKNYTGGFNFSPDGQKIAFRNGKGDIEIWGIAEKKQTILNPETYSGNSRQFFAEGGVPSVYFEGSFYFTPNSKMIVASYFASRGRITTEKNVYQLMDKYGFDQRTLLLDMQGKEVINNLDAYAMERGVTSSVDGEVMITSSGKDNENIDFWSLTTRKKLGTLQGLRSESSRVGERIPIYLTEDGKALIYSKQNTLLLWSLDPNRLFADSCNWLKDYLVNSAIATESDRAMCGITSKK